MKLSEAQASFDAGFAERFRYVLQQHERAILARMRMRDGDFASVIESNNYELRLTAGMFELSRFIDDRMNRNSAKNTVQVVMRVDGLSEFREQLGRALQIITASSHSPSSCDLNTSVESDVGTCCGKDEAAGSVGDADSLGDPEE